MPSVVHVVVTGNFAGVERYVCNTATELAARNWDVSVVGGDPTRMPGVLGSNVRWLPGETPSQALHSLTRLGRHDLCHVHMTTAELVGVATRLRHRAPIIGTRHFAAHRGSTVVTRALAPLISRGLAREIAISEFVARSMERRPDAVIVNGIPSSPCLWQPSSRVVLVMQRLEKEKDTLTALHAWQASRLMREQGWSMRIVGDGSQRHLLEDWVSTHGVRDVVFTGWTENVASELARAGLLLAPAAAEPLGLTVLEAMAAGVPVVACAGGGHLETIGRLRNAPLFPAEDSDSAAATLQTLVQERKRSSASIAGRRLVATEFTVQRHVDLLLAEYEIASAAKNAPNEKAGVRWRVRTSGSAVPDPAALREIVVCSLEAWDDVWRRNQFLTNRLLRRNPGLRVLFVEPPADPLFDLTMRRKPGHPRLRTISHDGRLRAIRPLKVLPRTTGPIADALLREQVLLGARMMGFSHPTLWINDVTYAPLITQTGWPSLYDMTDDWLLASLPPRELHRLRRLDYLALQEADEVVVCSQALVDSRAGTRTATLVANAVDVEHFRVRRPRPKDLPDGPVGVYVGSLHDDRIDVELVVELARTLGQVTFVFVGPNSLSQQSRGLLASLPNVSIIGPRPYADIPAYLQHADVVVVPHRVSPFTASLDPIKAYECLAIQTPTIATPVAGFREHGEEFDVVDRLEFTSRVHDVLLHGRNGSRTRLVPTWDERALEFESLLLGASRGRRGSRRTPGGKTV